MVARRREDRREGGRTTALLWFIPAFLWVSGALVVDAVLARQMIRTHTARTEWVEVTATITASSVLTIRSKDGNNYAPDLAFTYAYGGEDFQSNRYSFGSISTSDRAFARDVIQRHPVGAEVTARVDPENPEEAVLEVSGESFPTLTLLFLAQFHCVGVWLLGRFLRALRSRRRQPMSPALQRYVAMDDIARLVIRKRRPAPWEVTLFAFGVLNFIALFPLASIFGFMGASPYAIPAMTVCAVGAALVSRWSRARDRDPSRFLLIDRRLSTFSYPADAPGIPMDRVASLELSSFETGVTVNDVPQFRHELTALVDGEERALFRCKDGREVGEVLREALVLEFSLAP